MKEELVSIIIPAYNVDEYLEECVQSLLCQTYTNYEIIIIDDGSTDRTYTIGKQLASENTKIKLFHQENQGVSMARNIGMQRANGEYYIFVDADDVVMPRYIEILVACTQKANMGIIGYTLERERLATEVNLNPAYESAADITENILCGTNYDGYLWNKIFQRTMIKKYKLEFRSNIVVWEDMLFVLEYLQNCNKIAVSDAKLYYYRYREGSAVNNTRIDKYRSKYEVMAEIKRLKFACTDQSKKKISFLYFETMFSYLNQCFIRESSLNKINEILSEVDIMELLKQKNMKLFFKFLYLQTKVKRKGQ